MKLHKVKSKNAVSYYVIESFRKPNGGGTSSRVVEKLGTAVELKQRLGDEIDIESDFSICNKYNMLLMPTGSVIIKLNLEISDVGKIRNKKINEDILFGNIPEDISIYINNIDINEIEDTTFCGKVTIKLKNETDHPIMINQPYILYND